MSKNRKFKERLRMPYVKDSDLEMVLKLLRLALKQESVSDVHKTVEEVLKILKEYEKS